MFTFLLVVQAIIAALLVTVILLQKSEGGGLTTGGSPSGLMSARGAADFLTRSTAILGGLFILMSIVLAVMAATRHSATIDSSLQRKAAPVSTVPLNVPGQVPFGANGNSAAPAGAPAAGVAAPANSSAPGNSQVPFNQ